MLTYYLVNLWSKKRHKLTEFVPPWYDTPQPDPNAGALRLFDLAKKSMAERGEPVADDLNPDR